MALPKKERGPLPTKYARHQLGVDIEIDHPTYQEFLSANRFVEEVREEHGYVTPEALERRLKAVQALDAEAQRRLGDN